MLKFIICWKNSSWCTISLRDHQTWMTLDTCIQCRAHDRGTRRANCSKLHTDKEVKVRLLTLCPMRLCYSSWKTDTNSFNPQSQKIVVGPWPLRGNNLIHLYLNVFTEGWQDGGGNPLTYSLSLFFSIWLRNNSVLDPQICSRMPFWTEQVLTGEC